MIAIWLIETMACRNNRAAGNIRTLLLGMCVSGRSEKLIYNRIKDLVIVVEADNLMFWRPGFAHSRVHVPSLSSIFLLLCLDHKSVILCGAAQGGEDSLCLYSQQRPTRCRNFFHNIWASLTMANTRAQTDFWALCHMKDLMAS